LMLVYPAEYHARVTGIGKRAAMKRAAGVCVVVVWVMATVSPVSGAPVTSPPTDLDPTEASRLAVMRTHEDERGSHDTITYDGKTVRVIPRETVLHGAAKVPDLEIDSAGNASLGVGGPVKAAANHRKTIPDSVLAKDLASAEALLKAQSEHPNDVGTEKLLGGAKTHLPLDVFGADDRYLVSPTTDYSANAFRES
jgi:hypothetical protein